MYDLIFNIELARRNSLALIQKSNLVTKTKLLYDETSFLFHYEINYIKLKQNYKMNLQARVNQQKFYSTLPVNFFA